MTLLEGRSAGARSRSPAALPSGRLPESVSAWHPGITFASGCLAVVNLLALSMRHQPVLLGAAGLLVLLAALGYATYCALPGPPGIRWWLPF